MTDPEESSPLLNHPVAADGQEAPPAETLKLQPKSSPPAPPDPPVFHLKGSGGWTADGVPVVASGHVVGRREQWDSSLFAFLGRNDEFCGSDLEVCVLGSVAPCVLYGSNVERLGAGPGSFANSCLPYAGLYMLGNSLFGGNCIAPWFSYPSRTAIRRKFNLEGTCEAASRSFGCCSSIIEDDVKREQMESVCDFATHYLCHPCSLCQEGRELRRRLPHPGFNRRAVVAMVPPAEQTMVRGCM